MTRRQSKSGMLLVAVFALHATAASASQAIAKSPVVAAMHDAGIEVSTDRVIFLTGVIAQIKDPRLRAETVERWGEHKIRVRLACVEAQECMPFFVAVQWDQKDDVPVLSHAVMPNVPVMTAVTARVRSAVVHLASSAMLQLDGVHVHIWVTVICLEDGAIGQTIHATSKDGRQAYSAEVIGAGKLRGTL